MKCLDALYRNRRVELLHVRILRLWGWRGVAPNPAWARERCEWRLWHEALGRLDGKLRARGFVAGNVALESVPLEVGPDWPVPCLANRGGPQ